MNEQEILAQLRSCANPANVAGMARYGINTEGALGVSMPFLRGLAKRIGRDHALALRLWFSGIHEARILAALVDDPGEVSEAQLEAWVAQFASWDVCDQVCFNLFDRTPFAVKKIHAWSRREETFVRRAGFVLMAALAVHDKMAPDALFLSFLPLIQEGAADDRNFVKKAVNWALRQIGKRSLSLHGPSLEAARAIARMPFPCARWIARDAILELTGEKVLRRLGRVPSREGRIADP